MPENVDPPKVEQESTGIPSSAKAHLWTILGAIGGALLVGLGPPIWDIVFDRRPPIELKIFVFSSGKGNVKLPGAEVRITGDALSSQIHVTNPEGIASFMFDAKEKGQKITITVSNQGYRSVQGRQGVVPIGSAPESIPLDPIPIQDSLSMQVNSPTQASSTSTLATGLPSTSPLQVPTETSLDIQRVFTSGPKPSGLGKDWSDWYELCSDAQSPDYVIRSVDFALRGDRACDSWAECKEVRQTTDVVCYQFRLQGHEEWRPPHPSFTEAILRVRYDRRGIAGSDLEIIYPKDRSGRIYDADNHVWAQNFKINKQSNTISYESAATAKECIPTGKNGAWLSIQLHAKDDRPIATYDNVDVVNVENARNVFRHSAILNQIEKDDLNEAVYFIPVMRGSARCN
jgi:hypothetical protein